MNKKTTYELTITEKLEQLPLPDMEDAIWARVKAQLDLDFPSDDSNDGDAPDTPTGGSWVGWGTGMFIIVAAIVSIFLLTKKPSRSSTPQPTETVETTAPVTSPTQENNNTPTTQHEESSATPLTSPGISPPLTDFNVVDSAKDLPLINLPLPDSGQRSVVVLPPVTADTIAPKKKTRGVTGITNDDYRIVPATKDSL